MDSEQRQVLKEIRSVSTQLERAEEKVRDLKRRQLFLFKEARAIDVQTPTLAQASGMKVGTVRQVLNRANEGN